MRMDQDLIPLFAYGTLQIESVQLAQFGCRLAGTPDAILGYRRETIEIDDPETVALSGERFHAIVVATGVEDDEVEGTLLWLTAAQLAAADAYEVDAYRRVEVPLRSGGTAWAYVKA
jgi:hypothetical protein